MAGRKRRRPRVEGLEARRMLSVTIAEYPTSGLPGYVVAAPDGDIWFTQGVTGGTTEIVVYNPTTQASTTVPFAGGGITLGPDGNIWSLNSTSVASINPTTHAITTIPLPASITGSNVIAPGPGNDLAFVASAGNVLDIGLIDATTHAITIDPTGLSNENDGLTDSGIDQLAAGPDGNLWFAYGTTTNYIGGSSSQGDIGILTPGTGSVTTIPLTFFAAWGIAAGPDGNMYFTAYGGDGQAVIGTVNPTTHAVTETDIPWSGAPRSITLGTDGNLWFAEVGPGNIGAFDPSTKMFDQYVPPLANSAPYDITPGPGDTLWFTDIGSRALGVVQLGAPLPPGSIAIIGSVFLDTNINGTLDPNEAPLAGETVYLDLKGDGTLDTGDPTAVTDAGGHYTLTASSPGTYTIRVATYPGDIATGPNGGGDTVTLAIGSGSPIVDIGLVPGGPIAPLHPASNPLGTGSASLYAAELTGLYTTILGRPPDPDGLAYWEGALASGISLAQVASAFLHSAEYESDVVASYYEGFYGRAASPAELSAWVSYIQASGDSLESIADLFLTNPAYNALHASDADFIQSLYGNLLGRQASAQEIAGWSSNLNGGWTRAQMVQFVIGAADTRAIEGDYEAIFGRQADSGGLAWAQSALQRGTTLVDLDVLLFSSDEYATRAARTVTA